MKPSAALEMMDSVKEPAVALGAEIVPNAVGWIERCPTDEAAWYELARGIEMREALSSAPHPGVVIEGRKLRSLAEVTAEAVRRVPTSPRVALVDARARPEPGRLAGLVARFPNFAPLRLALARAQLAAGNPEGAEKTLALSEDVKALAGTPGARSAIKLARGEPSRALAILADAGPDLLPDRVAGSEAYLRTGVVLRERYEVSYKAQLALHRPGAAVRPLLDAAEHGSEAARALLENPGSQLLEAIAAARRAGKLNAVDRDYLKH